MNFVFYKISIFINAIAKKKAIMSGDEKEDQEDQEDQEDPIENSELDPKVLANKIAEIQNNIKRINNHINNYNKNCEEIQQSLNNYDNEIIKLKADFQNKLKEYELKKDSIDFNIYEKIKQLEKTHANFNSKNKFIETSQCKNLSDIALEISTFSLERKEHILTKDRIDNNHILEINKLTEKINTSTTRLSLIFDEIKNKESKLLIEETRLNNLQEPDKKRQRTK